MKFIVEIWGGLGRVGLVYVILWGKERGNGNGDEDGTSIGSIEPLKSI